MKKKLFFNLALSAIFVLSAILLTIFSNFGAKHSQAQSDNYYSTYTSLDTWATKNAPSVSPIIGQIVDSGIHPSVYGWRIEIRDGSPPGGNIIASETWIMTKFQTIRVDALGAQGPGIPSGLWQFIGRAGLETRLYDPINGVVVDADWVKNHVNDTNALNGLLRQYSVGVSAVNWPPCSPINQYYWFSENATQADLPDCPNKDMAIEAIKRVGNFFSPTEWIVIGETT